MITTANTNKNKVLSTIAAVLLGVASIMGLQGCSSSGGDELVVSSLPGKQILNGCGAYNIHQSASLVRQAKVLLTNDTGLMHIGAAFQRKIISIWGNTVPSFGMYPFKPHPASIQFEVKTLSCRPCSKIGYQKCPKSHFKCMLEQDLDGMVSACMQLWETP